MVGFSRDSRSEALGTPWCSGCRRGSQHPWEGPRGRTVEGKPRAIVFGVGTSCWGNPG